jgi:hypothetical protein
MPLLQPILALPGYLSRNRVPIVRQRDLDMQANLPRKFHDLVQLLETVLALVKRELAVLDQLEPHGTIARDFGHV